MRTLRCAVAEDILETTIPDTWSIAEDHTSATFPQASADDPPRATLQAVETEQDVASYAVGQIEKIRAERSGFLLVDSRPLAHPDFPVYYVLCHYLAEGMRPTIHEQWFVGLGHGGCCQAVLSVTSPVIAWPGMQSASARMGNDLRVRSDK